MSKTGREKIFIMRRHLKKADGYSKIVTFRVQRTAGPADGGMFPDGMGNEGNILMRQSAGEARYLVSNR
jgi:hypothetical protein